MAQGKTPVRKHWQQAKAALTCAGKTA